MPSYPGAVISFTAKVSGGNIDPAHINDIQDEVNAIEGGLLNGTARLNSSASTLASLSVSGGSTFTSRPVAPPPDAALVFLESTVTLGSSAGSTVSWLADAFETNSSLHSTGTNPERLIPQSTGIYQASAQLSFSSNSTGHRQLVIQDSSAGLISAQLVTASTDGPFRIQAAGYKRFDVTGGYVVALHNSAGNTTLSLTTGVGETWFSLVKL